MNHWNDLPELVRDRAPKIIQRALNVLIIGAPTPKVAGPTPLPEGNTDAINAYFESQPEIDPEDDWDLVPDIPVAVDAEYYDSAEGEEYDEEGDWHDSGHRVSNEEEDHPGARARLRPSLGDDDE